MITIIATDPSFGASYNIKKALTALDETALLCSHTDPWRKRPEGTITAVISPKNAARYLDRVTSSRFIFVVGGSSINILKMFPRHSEWVHTIPLVAWMTDSYYRKHSVIVNQQLAKWHCKQMFVQPDDTLYPLVPGNTVPLMHPISLAYEPKKPTRVLVMHSPGTKTKRAQKGSGTIEEVARRLQGKFQFDYRCLMKLPHAQCLERKAQAHIFIDKLGTQAGVGLGKSGLEAMASGAVVLSALHDTNYTREFFQPPPVIKVTGKDDLETALRALLKRKDLVDLGHRSREWIAKYWGLENGTWLKYFRRYARV